MKNTSRTEQDFHQIFSPKIFFEALKNNKIFNFEDISKIKPTTRFC
jgi:hypothetical protein